MDALVPSRNCAHGKAPSHVAAWMQMLQAVSNGLCHPVLPTTGLGAPEAYTADQGRWKGSGRHRDRSMDPLPTALALPAARVQAQHWAQ